MAMFSCTLIIKMVSRNTDIPAEPDITWNNPVKLCYHQDMGNVVKDSICQDNDAKNIREQWASLLMSLYKNSVEKGLIPQLFHSHSGD